MMNKTQPGTKAATVRGAANSNGWPKKGATPMKPDAATPMPKDCQTVHTKAHPKGK